LSRREGRASRPRLVPGVLQLARVTSRPHPLRDAEEIEISTGGQRWVTSWHPPVVAPSGNHHGSAGICVTDGGDVVLSSADGASWDFPAGRPEGDETWEQTLRREMLEEACAAVTDARLLGFSRGRCVGGAEAGLVLVRSIWLARVELLAWEPQFEIRFRRLLPPCEAIELVSQVFKRVWERAFAEAGLK
jgi:8-oxo-dGTP pyrophosphatase MutT (NUDIX family)